MPCLWSCPAAADAVTIVDDADADGNNVEHWRDIRRRNLSTMRKYVRYLVIVMSLIEVMRVGPVQMAFAGKPGFAAPAGGEDYGLAYTVGSFMSWAYMCVFAVVYVPLFDWWLPTPTPGSSSDKSIETIGCFFTKVNLVLLHGLGGAFVGQYLCSAFQTFVYVDSHARGSSELPKNSKKVWLLRLLLLVSVAVSTALGCYAVELLDQLDMAHVKTLEYYVLLVPVQINVGVLMGTALQYKIEKRMERKAAPSLEEGKPEGDDGLDEKAAMLATA